MRNPIFLWASLPLLGPIPCGPSAPALALLCCVCAGSWLPGPRSHDLGQVPIPIAVSEKGVMEAVEWKRQGWHRVPRTRPLAPASTTGALGGPTPAHRTGKMCMKSDLPGFDSISHLPLPQAAATGRAAGRRLSSQRLWV